MINQVKLDVTAVDLRPLLVNPLFADEDTLTVDEPDINVPELPAPTIFSMVLF